MTKDGLVFGGLAGAIGNIVKEILGLFGAKFFIQKSLLAGLLRNGTKFF